MNKKMLKALSLACAGALAAGTLAGCGKGGAQAGGGTIDDSQPFKISIMTNFYQPTPVTEDSPVKKKVEELTNTEIDFRWVPSSSYAEKLSITMASGDLPMMLFVGSKTPNVLAAVKANAFWEVGDLYKDYKYLSQAKPIVLNNSSIEGKVYGVYRARPLGRHGFVYRKDWLDNVGMQPPKTIDDFYNMLVAFTNNDPDKNGKADTYGMILPNHKNPFDIISVWFGAPNEWGEDENGELIPTHLTPEYFEAVEFFKKLYDENLLNRDFAAMDVSKWEEPFIAGKGGVIVDTTDRANLLSQKTVKKIPEAEVSIIGAVEGPNGLHSRATDGYSGMYMFPKQSVKNEATLKRIMQFMDDCGDPEVRGYIEWGIEGRHYNKVGENYIEVITDNNMPKSEYDDFNQILSNIGDYTFLKKQPTPLTELSDNIQKENESIVVANPAAPLTSDTMSKRGSQLENIVLDARNMYIAGKIDKTQYDAEMERWKNSGGNDVIKEMNEAYKVAKANQ